MAAWSPRRVAAAERCLGQRQAEQQGGRRIAPRPCGLIEPDGAALVAGAPVMIAAAYLEGAEALLLALLATVLACLGWSLDHLQTNGIYDGTDPFRYVGLCLYFPIVSIGYGLVISEKQSIEGQELNQFQFYFF